ncbi:Vitamin K-dependent gamma-carboxylase [Fodinibius roseus]|uniref:Vitamin K-dependent gamma-carboxylase n=1 Tax=Fodinibius roseus TaxID=1194090 RepID=A0A1M4UGM0_9BACT|nr:HTTM domain-containing protein [Fodinibius roseus]SHE55876.1 Vitamin K-dependent gamma-carboxylase [Fodinibius roseus]
MIPEAVKKHITSQVSIAPLAVFRFLFGFIMLVSVIRFALKGWIYELYVEPDYFFTYYGFDWVTPPGETGMYLLFLVMGLAALSVMLGCCYRIGIILFFLCFTYVELIDKTNYLNHYYFVSIISFLLIWVPANRSFSLDVLRKPAIRREYVAAWTINIFKLQLGLVYFFAGAAKLNPDWLINAMPMRIWLPARADLPIIGPLLEYTSTAYIFSWAGAVYDLTIAFFLLWKPTRFFAYITVIIFHMMTYFLFQIGMFPFIMILCTLIFFPADFHKKIITAVSGLKRYLPLSFSASIPSQQKHFQFSKSSNTIIAGILGIHFILQLLLPLRFALYPGNLFWTEQGYRFSWRVMLMEKAGHITFHIKEPESDRRWQVQNYDYLTPNQEKMMSTQPDMILQFAHHLEEKYRKQGINDVKITAETYVTLNGRRSQLLIDPKADLTKQERGFTHKNWILPFNENQQN